MKKFIVLIAAGAVAALMVMPASPAQAETCVTVQKQTGDPSWSTVCNRERIAVCDADQDGHMAYAHFWPQWYTDFLTTDYDSYGYTNGQFCHHETPGVGWGIDRFQICVQTEGCSAWKDAG
jgi:hypothetical protein